MFLHSILSTLIFLPISGGVAILAFSNEHQGRRAKLIALISSLLSISLCFLLYYRFDLTLPTMQFQESSVWIQPLNIYYFLGIDGISLPMILLTCFITLLVVLDAWHTIHEKITQYLAAFLIMQGIIVGVFSALDSILFYVFWEAMLIPMYLAIGIWGSQNRFYASIKFFIYTFFGSALMLVALLYLRYKANSFSILDFYSVQLNMLPQTLIFLAAIMLKIGAYGFLRFSFPIVPDACKHFDLLLIILSLFAIIYIGFIAIIQKDMKRLIAYSSIAHMGFVTLGCFSIYRIVEHSKNISAALMSIEGAMVQMVSHGFSSAALFLGVGILYHQLHTRLIKDYGGVANTMPVFAAFFMLFMMANVGLPGTSGFVGEFMVILSSFQANPWIAFLATSTVVLSAAYSLWMYKRVFYIQRE